MTVIMGSFAFETLYDRAIRPTTTVAGVRQVVQRGCNFPQMRDLLLKLVDVGEGDRLHLGVAAVAV